MFKIISDGGCDFSKQQVADADIEVVPFYITFDEKTFLKEGIDININEYFDKIKNDKKLFAKTSQPNPADYVEVFKPYLEKGEDIICLTISSKLSGSYQSAKIAADMLKEEYPKAKIALVDSLNGSVGQGLILREMLAMQSAGLSLEEVVELANKVAATTKIYFTLDTLEYLKRGGRVGPTTALVGGILGLRPVLQLVDGSIEQLDNVRGKQRVIGLIVEGVTAALKGATDKVSVGIGHILRTEDVESFKRQLEESLQMKIDTPITDVGVTIGAHAGPGGLVVAYCKKYTEV